MIVVDKLCYRSKLRYVNAGEKVAYSMSTLLLCIISRSILVAGIVFWVNGILIVKKGGVGLLRYTRLLAIPLTFIILSTLAIIVNFSKAPLDAYAIPVGTFFITGSQKSLHFAVQLVMTAMASVSCLYFLSLNTTMTDILDVLGKMHCPVILIELMMLIYRFIFVLMETASAIMVSQKSRLGNRNLRTSILSFGQMGAGLFIRALKRANVLYDAMESRCYDGKIKVLSVQHPVKWKDVAVILLFELFLIGLTIWGKIA